jgi:hypothetical protein
VRIGKRQIEQLAQAAAADVEAFYAAPRPEPADPERLLVLSFDGTGIVTSRVAGGHGQGRQAGGASAFHPAITWGEETAVGAWPSWPTVCDANRRCVRRLT